MTLLDAIVLTPDNLQDMVPLLEVLEYRYLNWSHLSSITHLKLLDLLDFVIVQGFQWDVTDAN